MKKFSRVLNLEKEGTPTKCDLDDLLRHGRTEVRYSKSEILVNLQNSRRNQEDTIMLIK